MAQVPETIQNPGNAIEVQEHARATSRVINGDLGFGSPDDPLDTNSTNGRKDNMAGSWVSLNLDAADFFVQGVSAGVAVACAHNLNLSVNGVEVLGSPVFPNVVWDIKGVRAGTTHGPIQLVHRNGDAIGANSIELRALAGDDAPTTCTIVVWFAGVTPW